MTNQVSGRTTQSRAERFKSKAKSAATNVKTKAQNFASNVKTKSVKYKTDIGAAYYSAYKQGYSDWGKFPMRKGSIIAACLGYRKGLSDRKKSNKIQNKLSR